MLRSFLSAAALIAVLGPLPASAEVWINYDGYKPYPYYAYGRSYGYYGYPYGYPFSTYTDVTVGVPVVTYAPMNVRIYTTPIDPPYYNVPPYAVYAPY